VGDECRGAPVTAPRRPSSKSGARLFLTGSLSGNDDGGQPLAARTLWASGFQVASTLGRWPPMFRLVTVGVLATLVGIVSVFAGVGEGDIAEALVGVAFVLLGFAFLAWFEFRRRSGARWWQG
jgi:hypothetical protein